MKRFELDILGQYSATTINEKHSGVFSITVYLKEKLNLEILKQATDSLLEMLPFLSGRLQHNFFWYEYEITGDSLPLIPVEKAAKLENNKHIFSIAYGERHFILRVNHILCDGRTLSKITKALLMRYFELSEINLDNKDKQVFNEFQNSEILENAYQRFTDYKTNKAMTNKKKTKISAYQPPISETATVQMLSYPLSASRVKATAKKHQATVSEFLLALIFKSIAVERQTFNRKEPIRASIPIDCRAFFPSKTMRNFVGAENITMPEDEDFTTMTKKLRIAFDKIDKDSVYKEFSSLQKTYQAVRYLPRICKDRYMKRLERLKSNEYTTGFSNVGKIDLPENILEKINSMEFFAETDGMSPYYFSCITAGDILTLAVTIKVDNCILIQELEKNLTPFFT